MKWKVLKLALSLAGQIRPTLSLSLCTFSGPQCDSVEYRGSLENISITITESPTSHARLQMNTETSPRLPDPRPNALAAPRLWVSTGLLLVTISISVTCFRNALGTAIASNDLDCVWC